MHMDFGFAGIAPTPRNYTDETISRASTPAFTPPIPAILALWPLCRIGREYDKFHRCICTGVLIDTPYMKGATGCILWNAYALIIRHLTPKTGKPCWHASMKRFCITPNQGTVRKGRAAIREFILQNAKAYDEQLTDLVFFASAENDKRFAAEYIVSGAYLVAETGLSRGAPAKIPASRWRLFRDEGRLDRPHFKSLQSRRLARSSPRLFISGHR